MTFIDQATIDILLFTNLMIVLFFVLSLTFQFCVWLLIKIQPDEEQNDK